MLCTRCGGLLITDDSMDLYQESSQIRSQGYRCVNCGYIEDPTIRANRRLAVSAKYLGPGDPGGDGRRGLVESMSSNGDLDERRCDAPEWEH